MSIFDIDFTTGLNKLETAISRFREWYPKDGNTYYGGYSGGKDSDTIMKLAELAGTPVEWHYHQGGIDPAEIVYHVRNHPDVIIDRPEKPILQLIPIKGLPIRTKRWCCKYVKESGGNGRIVITGVRAGESTRRKHYPIIESDITKSHKKILLRPIIDWTKYDVWEFLKYYSVDYCMLYDEGASGKYKGDGTFQRLGCILCPMESRGITKIDLDRFPKVAEAWRRAAFRLYEKRKVESPEAVEQWPTFNDMWYWWLARDKPSVSKLQGILV